MNEYNTLFISPALDALPGVKMEHIPRNKEELKKIFELPEGERKIVERKHVLYRPQRILEWMTMNDTYELKIQGSGNFEPYFVVHRNTPLYDETFAGCYYDKLSHVNNMRYLRFKMMMLPDTFIIHLNHTDLGNYTDWCHDYKKLGNRYKLKTSTFEAMIRTFKGLLANPYYPPWLGNMSSSVLRRCSKEEEACDVNGFTLKIVKVRSQIQFLETSLVFFLIAFVVVVVFYFKKEL